MPRLLVITWAAGQHRHVLQHRLAAIAGSCRYRRDLEAAAQLVDDEGRERLAFHVLGDDQQRMPGLHDALQQWQERRRPESLFSLDQDVGLFQFGASILLRVGDGARARHSRGRNPRPRPRRARSPRLGFLDGAHALVADQLHRFRDHAANPGDAEIGRMISEAMQRVGNEGVITVEEAKGGADRARRGRGHAVRPRLCLACTSSPTRRR